MKNLKNLTIYKNRYDVPNDDIVLLDASEVSKEITELKKQIRLLKKESVKK